MTGALAVAVVSVWTNVAGNVISAAPVRIAGKSVEMVAGEEGKGMRFPLATFPASERRRIRLALGEYELPRRAADIRAIFAADLARAEARAKAGRMTDEELKAKRANITAAWAHELEKPKHGLTKEEIEHWKVEGLKD